jgi:hypothetical protein
MTTPENENKPATTTSQSNIRAIMIVVVFLVMLVGLIAFEVMTKK